MYKPNPKKRKETQSKPQLTATNKNQLQDNNHK